MSCLSLSWLTLQCSHRFLTELCTFIPLACCCAHVTGIVAAGLTIAGLCARVGARAHWEMDRTVGCRGLGVGRMREIGLVRRDSALNDEMSEADMSSYGCDSGSCSWRDVEVVWRSKVTLGSLDRVNGRRKIRISASEERVTWSGSIGRVYLV